MNVWLLSAGLAGVVVWAIHTFPGGRAIARPLVAARDIESVPKWTQYYCWHLVTITLAVMAAALVYAAFVPEGRDVALFVGGLATLFGVFGVILPRRVGQSYAAMPQGFLLLPIGLLALYGAW